MRETLIAANAGFELQSRWCATIVVDGEREREGDNDVQIGTD